MTQDQIVLLYQSSKSNISEHIKHIIDEGELSADSVVRNFRITASYPKKTIRFISCYICRNCQNHIGYGKYQYNYYNCRCSITHNLIIPYLNVFETLLATIYLLLLGNASCYPLSIYSLQF